LFLVQTTTRSTAERAAMYGTMRSVKEAMELSNICIILEGLFPYAHYCH
jgi:hypothetical protein